MAGADRARLRRDAERAWRAGVAAVDATAATASALASRPDLDPANPSTWTVAVGKAAIAMMRAAPAVSRGLVVAPAGEALARARREFGPRVEVLAGDHPCPGPSSLEAGRRLLAGASRLGAGQTLLVLLSGGASSLVEAPRPGLSPQALASTYERLVASGEPIARINRERAKLSLLKGGGLARAAAGARVATLAISDVEGDDPATIGSGPTVGPQGDAGDFTVVARAADARRAAAAEALRLGYGHVIAEERYLSGTTREAAARILEVLAGAAAGAASPAGHGAFAAVWAGETTVAIDAAAAPGRGGRNLDLAARLALAWEGEDGLAACVGGTDGKDGSSRAAGAVIDGGSAARARAAKRPLEAALSAYDTEPALEGAGDLLLTGPTETNVGDLVVVVARGRAL